MAIALTRPSEAAMAGLATRLQGRPFTYTEIGATAGGFLPAGYRHDRRGVEIGTGEETWIRAQEALQTWQGHRHAHASISPARAALEPGVVVIATVRVGPLVVVAPCRIVYVTSDADRFGFAYGTLPGHPECGEEAFHVRRDSQGTVSVEIVAFSRPAALIARAGSPVARAVQQRTTARYLEGVRSYATQTR